MSYKNEHSYVHPSPKPENAASAATHNNLAVPEEEVPSYSGLPDRAPAQESICLACLDSNYEPSHEDPAVAQPSVKAESEGLSCGKGLVVLPSDATPEVKLKYYLLGAYTFLNRGLHADYMAGGYLYHLKKLVGHGNFCREVNKAAEEWGCSTATLRRKLEFYIAVRKNLVSKHLLPYNVPELDQYLEPSNLGDEGLAKAKAAVDAAAAETKKQLAAHKASGRLPSITLKLEGLPEGMTKGFHANVKQLKVAMGSAVHFSEWLALVVADKAADCGVPVSKEGKLPLVFNEEAFDE